MRIERSNGQSLEGLERLLVTLTGKRAYRCRLCESRFARLIGVPGRIRRRTMEWVQEGLR